VSTADTLPDPPTMCAQCLNLTRRSYRAGAWFFYFVGPLFALFFVVMGFATDWAFYSGMRAKDLGLLLGILLLPAALGHGIQFFGRKLH